MSEGTEHRESTARSSDDEYPVPDPTKPQLTVRALATGMLLGGVLSLCNIYSGLKIGWSFPMSITASLLAFALWRAFEAAFRTRPFGVLENHINQTAASSAASISSAGLVAGIPALTLLTGYQWRFHILVVWVFVVCMVGIVVAIGLRKQMIVVDRLRFPSGVAAAETLRNMYGQGTDALRRVGALGGAALFAGAVTIVVYWRDLTKWAIPGWYPAPAAVAAHHFTRVSFGHLTWALDPSPLMLAVGALVGLRGALSMMLGAALAWGVLGPYALEQGWAQPGLPAAASWYPSMLKWLLWPGVAMMVTSSLTSFAFSWRSMVSSFLPKRSPAQREDVAAPHDVPRRVFFGSLVAVMIAGTVAQVLFFDIRWWTALIGVLLSFVLAVVAGRVTGETNLTPVGAMGKVTQLVFGVIEPGRAAANLMSATVTGGAASQCADLLQDLKTGALIGGAPRSQALAQVLGALAGSVMGCAGYLVLLPDPERQIPSEWAAPAVMTWKGVAELFVNGLEAMPPGALDAGAIGAAVGIVLALLEKLMPKNVAKWTPSPAGLGLAFVIPASNALSIFAGAVLIELVTRVNKPWAERYVVVIASGLIAGESLVGVSLAIYQLVADALR